MPSLEPGREHVSGIYGREVQIAIIAYVQAHLLEEKYINNAL